MKPKSKDRPWIVGAIGVVATALTLLPGNVAAGPDMPIDVTWDCTVNGSQGRGVAFLTFHADYTFDGGSIMTVNNPAPTPDNGDDENPRGSNSSDSRGTSSGGSSTNDTSAVVTAGTSEAGKDIYGYGRLGGQWGYDAKHNVIGYFQQVVETGDGTNSVSVTNSIGFKAIISGRKMTLVASTPNNGKSTYQGIYQREIPDLTGAWYGKQSGNGQTLVEFFDLIPTEIYGLYQMVGTGASYDIQSGWVMLSATKRIAFAATLSDGNLLRTSVGTYYKGQRKAQTTGFLDPASRIKYNAFHYPD